MLAASTLFVLLHLVGDVDDAASAPAWCAPAQARLAALADVNVDADASHVDDLDALLAALPPAIGARARDDQGRSGRRSAAVDAAATAVAFACRVDRSAVVTGDPRAEARALLSDPRFSGTRADEDVFDRVLDRVWRWLEVLLASDGMKVFADNTRTIYLTALFVVTLVVGVRLTRNARRTQALRAEAPDARVERERARAFSAWRAEAEGALALDPRRALLLARTALLARVGEVDALAVRPSRTSREVLAALTPAVAACVAPALQRFDAAFFGGSVDADAARALLAAVDDAAVALAAAPASSVRASTAGSTS